MLAARVAQLVLTVTAVPGVDSVQLLIDGGTPLGLFPGYATKFPITAADVRDEDVPAPEEPPRPRREGPERLGPRAPGPPRRPRLPAALGRRRPVRRADALRGHGLPEVGAPRPRRHRRPAHARGAGEGEAADAADDGLRPPRRGPARPPARALHLRRPRRPHAARLHRRARLRHARPAASTSSARSATRGRCPTGSGCRGRATSSAASPSTSRPTCRRARPRTAACASRATTPEWLYDRLPNGTAVTVLATS